MENHFKDYKTLPLTDINGEICPYSYHITSSKGMFHIESLSSILTAVYFRQDWERYSTENMILECRILQHGDNKEDEKEVFG